jgi:hypothetical protein
MPAVWRRCTSQMICLILGIGPDTGVQSKHMSRVFPLTTLTYITLSRDLSRKRTDDCKWRICTYLILGWHFSWEWTRPCSAEQKPFQSNSHKTASLEHKVLEFWPATCRSMETNQSHVWSIGPSKQSLQDDKVNGSSFIYPYHLLWRMRWYWV